MNSIERCVLVILAAASGSLPAQAWVPLGPDLHNQNLTNPTAVYDPLSRRLLAVDALHRTWSMRPGTFEWVRVPDASNLMTDRPQFVLGHDPVRNRALLIGLVAPVATREWDGHGWRVVDGSATPSSVAFDAARNRLVGVRGSSRLPGVVAVFERVGVAWNVVVPAATVPAVGPIAYDPVAQRILMHGESSNGVRVTTTFDGAAWTVVATQAGPGGYPWPTPMATDPVRNRVVALAGTTTWEWDGSAWSAFPVAGLPATHGRNLLFEPAIGRVLAFGGRAAEDDLSAADHDDVWVWNGAFWTPWSVTGPSARNEHAMAADPVRGEVVLFGGRDGHGPLGDTAIFDGVRWSPRPSAPVPPARFGHALAFDATAAGVALFGGNDGSADLDDHWLHDGVNWRFVSAGVGPSARADHAMAFDLVRGELIVFGGRSAGAALADTWLRSGGAWRTGPSLPVGSPLDPMLAHDPVRGLTVLHSSAGTWEWDGVQYVGGHTGLPLTIEDIWFDPRRGRVQGFAWVRVLEWDGSHWNGVGPQLRRSTPSVRRTARLLSLPGSGDTFLFDGRVSELLTPTPGGAVDAGAGCGGPVPVLAARFAPTLGEAAFALDVHAGVAVQAPAIVGLALATTSIPLGSGCVWYLQSAVSMPFLATDGNGFASSLLPLPASPTWLGLQVHAQAVVLVPAAPLGLRLSQAVTLTLGA